LQTISPESKFPNEYSDVIFIQIDQHLKSDCKNTKVSRFYESRCRYCNFRLPWMTLKLISAVQKLCESNTVEICHIWHLVVLRDYQRLFDSTFSYRNNNEGLLKVTSGHVRYASANISETVRDIDIGTMDW